MPDEKPSLKISDEAYEVIPDDVVSASKILQDMYTKLGKPQDPFCSAGTRMTEIIIAVWEDLYPLQSKMWFEDRKEYQDNEKTIQEQVKQRTGRSLASYPLPIYNMFKKIFPKVNLGDKPTCIKMVKKWPMFRMANKI